MAYGCTITVAAGKIPSSQSNFVWLATEDNFPTAAIDGGATSILNGGGNLRCYTDSTKATRLPIEVVTFVTGGTPSAQVWGLSPTINVGSTVYIEADTVATTQPAVNDTYGRNAVWVDYEFVTHDFVIDSTGNTTLSSSGTLQSSLTPPPFKGDSTDFGSTSDAFYVEAVIANLTTYDVTAWCRPDALGFNGGDIAIIQDATSDSVQSSLLLDSSPDNFGMYNSPNAWLRSGVPSSSLLSSWNMLSGNNNGSNRAIYQNGAQIAASSSSVEAVRTLLRVGGRKPSNTTWLYSGKIAELNIKKVRNTADYKESEYNNQSAPSAFWATSAWEDQGGGGFQAAWAKNANKLLNWYN